MAPSQSVFVGFPDTPMRPVVIPDLFFTDLLPQIDNLAELKLTLHCFWLLNEQSSELRYLRGEDLRNDEVLLSSLLTDSELRTPRTVLEEAIENCLARNTLLRLEIISEPKSDEDPGSDEIIFDDQVRTEANNEVIVDEAQSTRSETVDDWYFLNTEKGRRAIARVRRGDIGEIRSAIPDEARLRTKRPNIFLLYEQNIGVMTPLIADQLRDLEKTYAPEWIEDAVEIAVSRNKRHLRYIQSILRRWEVEGRDGDDYGKPGGDSASERNRYDIPDEFSDIIIG